jgi:hypothetical protein
MLWGYANTSGKDPPSAANNQHKKLNEKNILLKTFLLIRLDKFIEFLILLLYTK